jgi:hypothetical protein
MRRQVERRCGTDVLVCPCQLGPAQLGATLTHLTDVQRRVSRCQVGPTKMPRLEQG